MFTCFYPEGILSACCNQSSSAIEAMPSEQSNFIVRRDEITGRIIKLEVLTVGWERYGKLQLPVIEDDRSEVILVGPFNWDDQLGICLDVPDVSDVTVDLEQRVAHCTFGGERAPTTFFRSGDLGFGVTDEQQLTSLYFFSLLEPDQFRELSSGLRRGRPKT
jgi:hypothetical protein